MPEFQKASGLVRARGWFFFLHHGKKLMSLISCPPPEMLSRTEMEAAVQPQELLLLFVLVSTEAGSARLQEQLPFCLSFQFGCAVNCCA